MSELHVFALNRPVAVSHTHLSRQKGEAPALPPLAGWLGVEALDTDRIELFRVEELGGMALSDYIGLAFAPEAMPREVQVRLDALEGSVLLVPDEALGGVARPGPDLTAIATIPLAEADHDATLPKAPLQAAPVVTPGRAPEPEPTPPIALYALIGILLFAAAIFLFGWGR
jgi:hypothetical protein